MSGGCLSATSRGRCVDSAGLLTSRGSLTSVSSFSDYPGGDVWGRKRRRLGED